MQHVRVKNQSGVLEELQVAEADKLSNARTIQTDLGSSAAPSFDGTANVSPGVTGTLPVANGGTGQTDLANVTVGNATSAEKVANALTVTVNGTETAYDGSSAQSVTVSASNPNLLYNSNFAINQRGNSSYTSAGYTFDGWRKTVSAGTVYLNSGPYPPINNCIYFSATSNVYLRQYLETSLKGSTTYTITIGYHTSTSVYISKETSYTFTTPSGTSSDTLKWTPFTGYTVMIYFAGTLASASAHCYVQFGRTSSSGTTYYFHYIKLEEGSVATPYEFPNPATELLKCQRYYINYTARCELMGSIYGSANRTGAGVWLPCPMRVKPTLVSEGTDNVHVDGGYVPISADGISIQHMSGNYLYMYLTLDQNKRKYDTTAAQFIHFELSAELTS